MWLEWSDAEKKKEELNKMETNKPRDLFIAKLLNKVKQQLQLQQQQQHSGDKRERSEDPEESWEDLVSEEDFSALSLESGKAEDLEPVRSLFRKLQSTPKYQRLLRERQQLPVFRHRSAIVEALKRHRVVVVAGETGSGKSTQVPHFLLEDLLLNEPGTSKCSIVCTQPRRISAVSLATRVCDELGCDSGPGGRVSCPPPSGKGALVTRLCPGDPVGPAPAECACCCSVAGTSQAPVTSDGCDPAARHHVERVVSDSVIRIPLSEGNILSLTTECSNMLHTKLNSQRL